MQTPKAVVTPVSQPCVARNTSWTEDTAGTLPRGNWAKDPYGALPTLMSTQRGMWVWRQQSSGPEKVLRLVSSLPASNVLGCGLPPPRGGWP